MIKSGTLFHQIKNGFRKVFCHWNISYCYKRTENWLRVDSSLCRTVSSFYIGFPFISARSKGVRRDILSDKNFNFGRGSIKVFGYLISLRNFRKSSPPGRNLTVHSWNYRYLIFSAFKIGRGCEILFVTGLTINLFHNKQRGKWI